MLANYESSQHYAGVVAIVMVEIGISPKIQRVQGVVTYASCVEAFANGIKVKSSDQRSFWSQSRDKDEY